MRNELCRLTRRPSRDYYAAALAGLVGLLLSASAGLAQQKGPPPVQANAIPTFEALPHTPFPPGEFVTWCGQDDQYLIRTPSGLQAYRGGAKVSAPLPISWPEVQCGQDGRELVFADTAKGQMTKVDIATGRSQLLATFPGQGTGAHISVSPDLRSVAADTWLWLLPAAENLRIVSVKRTPNGKGVNHIFWSPDGLKIAVFYNDGSIEVVDANGSRVGGGLPPKGTYAREGWFDEDQHGLVLHIFNSDDESESGSVIKCSISDWKCDSLKSRIDSASVGGRRLIGTIGPLDKPRPRSYDDSVHIYSRYAAELRGDALKPLAQQVFRTATGRMSFRIHLAPSGRYVALTWVVDVSPTCPKVGYSSFCQQGLIIDLAKVSE